MARFTEITANVTTSFPPLEYSLWQDGEKLFGWQESNIFLVEDAGTYELRCRDGNGCTIEPQQVVIKGGEVDFFERASLDFYNGNTGIFSITDSDSGGNPGAFQGDNYLMYSADNNDRRQIISTNGLPNYPDLNSTFSVRFRVRDSWNDYGNMDVFGILFGVQDGSNYYQLNLDNETGHLELWRDDTELASTVVNVNPPTNQWCEFYVEWRPDNEIYCEYRRENGDVLGTVTATDDTYESGGIGFVKVGVFVRIVMYFDQFEVLGTA